MTIFITEARCGLFTNHGKDLIRFEYRNGGFVANNIYPDDVVRLRQVDFATNVCSQGGDDVNGMISLSTTFVDLHHPAFFSLYPRQDLLVN